MNESLLNRILKDRKRRTRSLALILCLSMIVSLGTFAGFRKTAVAKVYTREVLDCPYTHEGAEPVAHVHNDDCYEGDTLVCTLPEVEAHTHSDACYTEREVLTCTLEENPGHQHGDACYTEHEEIRCGLEENPGHQHGDACYTEREVLRCGLEENPGHQHGEACYDENGVLTCQIPEGEGAHTHSAECYETVRELTCQIPEGEGAHTHTAECYETVRELTCQIPEGEGAHTHTAECYETVRELTCDKPELPVHVHGAECFRTEEITVDEPEATTAPEMPVSDPNADLESASDWERDFDGMELSGNWAQDLVLVAATQQGHGESQNNFEAVLNDAGDAWVRHGYTRYGAWYGAPYTEEWSAMFVSFCLRYAGIPVENVPNNPTAALMAESFSKGELFAGRDYVPAVGDLIFFDTDDIDGIDHMGIVYHVDEDDGSINAVEGSRTDAVETFGYHLDDEEIVGYGILPQNPNFVPAAVENEVAVEDEGEVGEDDGFIVMNTDEKEEEEKKETEETKPVEEVTAAEIPMPAQSWVRTAGGIRVSVEAPEGAFPENTKIAVTPVNGNSLKNTVSDAVSGEVLEVQAVDITFFDADGNEIEPAVPIRVVMTPAETEHAEEKANVVHVDLDQQTAEVIEQAAGTEADNSEVVFDADAFTIYAIVYTMDTYFRSYTGETYRVTMDFDESAGIPQNAKLAVSEILEESTDYDYDSLLSEAENALEGDKQIRYARFFDISISADGKEVQPSAPVSVKIQLADLPQEITANDAQVVHFGQKTEVLDVQASGTGVSFEANGFSVYAVVYTVDFAYEVEGQIYQYSIEGESSIALSGLIEILNVNQSGMTTAEFMAQVADVTFSTPELLEVVRAESDWSLNSLQPFTSNETLTITMKDGQQFVVLVTDAQTSLDLADFLVQDGVEVIGAEQKPDGTYVVKKGQPYNIQLSFKEIPEKLQLEIDPAKPLVYQLPTGIKAFDNAGSIQGNGFTLDYTINDAGLVTFSWNVTNEELFNTTLQAQDTAITFHMSAVFDSNSESIQFSNDATIKIDMDETAEVTAEKTGNYDANDNKMHYTVTVVSSGVNHNVTISDVLTGTGLSFNNDVTAKSDIDFTWTASDNGKGFTAAVPVMYDGERLILQYTADVKLEELTGKTDENGNMKYGTVEQTGNTVSVKSEEDQTPDIKPFSLDHQISASTLSKGAAEEGELSADGKRRTLHWTVQVNSERNVSMNGIPITDRISGDSQNLMSYSGDGITVVKRAKGEGWDAQGIKEEIPWNDARLVLAEDGKSWTFTPNDTEPYWYYITYTTEVDVSEQIVDYQVKNDISDQYGHAEASGTAKPDPKNRIGLEKKALAFNKQEMTIDWSVTIDVPPSGLTKAELVDTYPNAGGVLSNRTARDTLVGDINKDISVSGLNPGDSYTISPTTNPEYIDGTSQEIVTGFKIVFNKNNGSDGLTGTGSIYHVVVSFTTKVDQEWYEATKNGSYAYTHMNNASLDFGGEQKLQASDTVVINPVEPGITKTAENEKPYESSLSISGFYAPYWVYYIDLVGISDESFKDTEGNEAPLVITDTYPSEYLMMLDNENSAIICTDTNNRDHNGKLAATTANSTYDWTNAISVADGSEPGKITFTIEKDRIPRTSSGGYWSGYRISYILHVKNQAALDAMVTAAAQYNKGILPLKNTATWAGVGSDDETVQFETAVVKKEATSGQLNQSTGTFDVYYTVHINEKGLQIGKDRFITAKDSYSNLSIDYTSVECEPEDALIELQRQGDTITFILKNATPIVLRYKGSVRSGGEYHNVVDVNGQTSSREGYWEISSGGTVTSGDYKIKVLKHDGVNVKKTLSGAEFDFYRRYADGTEKLLIKGLTTDENGEIQIDSYQDPDSKETVDLVKGASYYLIETKAPVDEDGVQYSLIENQNYESNKVEFTIGDAADYDNHVYLNNDIIAIRNFPVEEESITLTLKKAWEGVSENDLPEAVVLHLYQKTDKYAETGDEVTDYSPITLTKDNSSGDGVWTATIENLPKTDIEGNPLYYFIKEEAIDGFLTEYSENNTLGVNHSGTLTVTNKRISVTVNKVWLDQEENPITDLAVLAKLPDVLVHLYKDGTLVDGKDVTLKASDGYTYTWGGLEPGNYTVTEETAGKQIGIVYKDTGETTVNSLDGISGTAVITNQVQPVTVKKIWNDNNNADGKRPASISVTLLKDGVQNAGRSFQLGSRMV